jgi:hypothetical protein
MANVTRVVSGCGRTIVTLGLATLLISSSRAQTPQSPQFDIILRGGTVFDGTGAPGFLGDVGIVGSHIASVGDLKERRAAIELDVKGLYVSPGFINIHSHASVAGLGSAENMLTQGVTTEILNADGAGPADLTPLLSRLDAGPLAVNAGACIGFNAIWTDVVGAADRRPTQDEVDRMRAKVDRRGDRHRVGGEREADQFHEPRSRDARVRLQLESRHCGNDSDRRSVWIDAGDHAYEGRRPVAGHRVRASGDDVGPRMVGGRRC